MEEQEEKKPLSSLTEEELKVLSSDIRSTILSVCSHNGGHLSSNLGMVETTISLFRNFNFPTDTIVFDVGHQTYAYKILSGRDITYIRKTGGISPFSMREESPYDSYDSGHAGDALSIAYGIAKSKQLKGDNSYTIALIGDGSITNGLTFEALNLLSAEKSLQHLIVILNDNGMAISQQVGYLRKKSNKLRTSRFYFRTSNLLGQKMSKRKLTWKIFLKMREAKDVMKRLFIEPTLFETIGLKYVGPYDGHDFQSLDLAFQKAKAVSGKAPVVLHLFTHKGYGYTPAMKDEEGKYHGVNPGFTETKVPDNSLTLNKIKNIYLSQRMQNDAKSYIITPAMEIGSGLTEIFRQYPSRCIDVGIAEENAVSYAAGLALGGLHPIVDIYSTFMQRSYDEIFEDCQRNRCNITFLVERCGLVGEDGASHQGLYDVAMLHSIPHTRCYMPFDESSGKYILEHMTRDDGAVFIRFTKDPISASVSYENHENHFVLERNHSKDLVISIGPKGAALLESLPDSFDRIVLIDLLPSPQVLDTLSMLSYRSIYFYDPYGIYAGTASVLSSYLVSSRFQGEFVPYCFKREFVPFGQCDDLMTIYHLSVRQIVKEIVNRQQSKDAVIPSSEEHV